MTADGNAPKPENGSQHEVVRELYSRFGEQGFTFQPTVDRLPTLWVAQSLLADVLRYLKNGVPKPYKMLYDLTAVDERLRRNRQGLPPSDFTVVYQLLSIERNNDVRLKVALQGDAPSLSLVAPTLETLLIYLTIAAFNALLVVLWGTYHKQLFPPPRKIQARSAPDDAITAADFALSSAQLHDVHGSRITVIHHTDDGEIAALQTDKLHIPPVSNSDIFDATRLA